MRCHSAVIAALVLLAGCTAAPPAIHPAGTQPPIVLLGEQHDAPGHPALQRDWVRSLARDGRLAALVLEMAERGATTAGLDPASGEAAVRTALRWDDRAWPWDRYGPVVMAAVRAGVPVHGANLPRTELRAAMADATLDALLDPAALAAQHEAIREGHCGLLPETQVAPMARAQVARDRAMAQTLQALTRADRTVVLLAGAGHVDPRLGVPRHLDRAAPAARPVLLPAEPTGTDHCAELRRQWQPRPPASPARP